MRAKLMLTVAFVVAAASTGVAAAGSGPVRVAFGAPSIDLYHSASVRVSGISARSAKVRPVGANDRHGPAYEWEPYRWQTLQAHDGTWRGLLPAPPLFGIYRVQLRVDTKVLSSPRWLLRVLPSGTLKRPSFSTAAGAVRHFVAHLPGHEVLVAMRRWRLAKFDHRDPRLNQLFVIAYTPHGESNPGSRLGLFISTVRNGYRGPWRVLEATTQPYD